MPLNRKCWLLKTALPPAIPERLPPTVKELFKWLRQWDLKLAQALQDVLGGDGYLHQEYVTFAIDTPVGWIGFGFDLELQYRLGYKKAPKKFRNYLHSAGGTQFLFRMSLRPIGSKFVHSRNLSYPDLRNKRVTVVGCGAVGSFVATALVRLGAGTGDRGRLRLIDPEDLGPENLGRHALGYPSLLRAKAVGLREELLRQFPHSHIEAAPQSAADVTGLFAADLIVEATGEEAVSEYVNGLRLQGQHGAPILHVWIRGNGEAVQALWADKEGDACYRCMVVPDPHVLGQLVSGHLDRGNVDLGVQLRLYLVTGSVPCEGDDRIATTNAKNLWPVVPKLAAAESAVGKHPQLAASFGCPGPGDYEGHVYGWPIGGD